MPTDTLDAFRFSLKLTKEVSTYDQLAELYGVNKFYLWKILNDPKYDPPNRIKDKLGIQKFASVEVCTCGGVHLKRRCPLIPRQRRDLYAYAESELAWMVEHREDWT